MTGQRLRVNPIRCDAYGHCAELPPELVRADEWGYPIVSESAVPDDLLDEAPPDRRSLPAARSLPRAGRGLRRPGERLTSPRRSSS